MNKKGFVFIETIISIVILTSSLLLLYSTFTKLLQSERARVYYDDPVYLYRTHYLAEKMNSFNLKGVIKTLDGRSNDYFMTIGLSSRDLFTNYESQYLFFDNMIYNFQVRQMIVFKTNKIDNIQKCDLKCSTSISKCPTGTTTIDQRNCSNLYLYLSDDFISYIKTVYIDVDSDHILVVEYATTNQNDTIKKNFYSWVGV